MDTQLDENTRPDKPINPTSPNATIQNTFNVNIYSRILRIQSCIFVKYRILIHVNLRKTSLNVYNLN